MRTDVMDRAAGVLLGQACGDALGVPHEFGPSLGDDVELTMSGGGPFGFDPGEYSDDTAMAVCIAQVAATGADLTTDVALADVAARFLAWGEDAKDVGNQTRAVFLRTSAPETMSDAAREYARTHERSAGNGALMRTAVVGLTRLDDRAATAAAAEVVCRLTHDDDLAVESCVLWSEAVRVAVTSGELDLLGGLDLLPEARRSDWRHWIEAATSVDPRTFRDGNGFTVTALQAAWAAVTWTQPDDASHLERAIGNAVRTGNDTDTVAAIAGGLLGARWGQSAVPSRWTRAVHGYPGLRSRDLVALATLTARGGRPDGQGWPTSARVESDAYHRAPFVRVEHPHDAGVVLGSYPALTDHGCDAVVSLCRLGATETPAGVPPEDHVEIRLVDSDDPTDNPHLEHVLADTVDAITQLRGEGKTVFVHCVAAEQRTPSVALAYAISLGVDAVRAAREVGHALPGARQSGRLWGSLGS
jgi:ADP-ribosylglycohydrolase